MAIKFDKEHGIGEVLFKWWQGLENDPASRAPLRRASTVTAVALTPAYQRVYRRLLGVNGAAQFERYQLDALAAAIGLLSHVKTDDSRPLAKTMSERPEGSDKPRVSELRFLRLLDASDLDALFTGLRRVLPLMNHEANVIALANDVVHWGDIVKKQWAYAYDWPTKAST